MSFNRVNILGVGIHPVNIPAALDTITSWIENKKRHYVCVTGVHGVMESQRDEALRSIHNQSGLTVPDGMPLVWLGRLTQHETIDRVYGPDLMLSLSEVAAKNGYRNFYYGATDDVLDKLIANLKSKFPQLIVAGMFSPPFRAVTDEEDKEIIKLINGSGADIVWVGLSTPKQERWMAAHIASLNAPALIGVGAAFDFHAGGKKQAPRWMQRVCLEWFFRLLQEPRRLWRRYLYANPRFILLILLQALRLRRYSLEP